jgi:ectoine hydroxylase-related dioxygenase (phytanoyl-CoA dioxygenase family)
MSIHPTQRMHQRQPSHHLIPLTEAEQRSEQLTEAHLQQGLALLTRAGFVILRGALPLDLVEQMKRQYDAIFADCQASLDGNSPAQIPWRSAGGTIFWIVNARLRAFIRMQGAFADARVVGNAFATQVLEKALGPRFYCNSVSSDTCMQGSTWQAPHRDIAFYPDGRPSGIIVNIPLMHCGLHNGPLEIWPGGNALWKPEVFARAGAQPFKQDAANPAMERFVRRLPALRLDLQPGDVLLRDPGLLHRGTPNPTPAPRVMLTIGYFREGAKYSFGRPEYNLDDASLAALDPRVRTLMEPRFLAGRARTASPS